MYYSKGNKKGKKPKYERHEGSLASYAISYLI